MFDPAVVEECAQCLAGAAQHEGMGPDLALAATALALDLADTHGGRATALLDRAAREATAYLDKSDLGAASFAAALRRLAAIRAQADAMLVDSPTRIDRLRL